MTLRNCASYIIVSIDINLGGAFIASNAIGRINIDNQTGAGAIDIAT